MSEFFSQADIDALVGNAGHLGLDAQSIDVLRKSLKKKPEAQSSPEIDEKEILAFLKENAIVVSVMSKFPPEFTVREHRYQPYAPHPFDNIDLMEKGFVVEEETIRLPRSGTQTETSHALQLLTSMDKRVQRRKEAQTYQIVWVSVDELSPQEVSRLVKREMFANAAEPTNAAALQVSTEQAYSLVTIGRIQPPNLNAESQERFGMGIPLRIHLILPRGKVKEWLDIMGVSQKNKQRVNKTIYCLLDHQVLSSFSLGEKLSAADQKKIVLTEAVELSTKGILKAGANPKT